MKSYVSRKAERPGELASLLAAQRRAASHQAKRSSPAAPSAPGCHWDRPHQCPALGAGREGSVVLRGNRKGMQKRRDWGRAGAVKSRA